MKILLIILLLFVVGAMAIKKKSLTSIFSSIETDQVLIVLLIIASFFIGSLYTKVQYLQKGGSGDTKATKAQTAPQTAPQGGSQAAGSKEVSVDDDPVLGDKNAPVTMIEFVDYE